VSANGRVLRRQNQQKEDLKGERGKLRQGNCRRGYVTKRAKSLRTQHNRTKLQSLSKKRGTRSSQNSQKKILNEADLSCREFGNTSTLGRLWQRESDNVGGQGGPLTRRKGRGIFYNESPRRGGGKRAQRRWRDSRKAGRQ